MLIAWEVGRHHCHYGKEVCMYQSRIPVVESGGAMGGGCGRGVSPLLRKVRKPTHYREYKGPESILQWTLRLYVQWYILENAIYSVG